jgi:hypothetical protein
MSCEDISALPARAASGITLSRSGSPVEKVSRQKKIHSTDNIVCLPIEVHRRVSARMSMRDKAYNFNIRRFGIEKRTFRRTI